MSIKQIPTTEDSPVDLTLGIFCDDDGNFYFDMVQNNGDMDTTAAMAGWVYNSLFNDAPAPEDVQLDSTDLDARRGWWGDFNARVNNDTQGSLLWLIGREKITNLVLTRAKEYCEQALQWMIDDLIATAVDVTVTRLTTRQGWVSIEIDITRPEGNRELFRFNYAWDGQAVEG